MLLCLIGGTKLVAQEASAYEFCNPAGFQLGECRASVHGFFRGIVVNRFGLPAIRPLVQFSVTGPVHFNVAKGSVFYVSGSYYRVQEVRRQVRRKGIKGCFTFIELPEKPHCIHICNRPKD
ncbi:MAG: hypothetical protein U0176_05640 [Bacteroidia bacterium]